VISATIESTDGAAMPSSFFRNANTVSLLSY
jgi:hypothetical protein